MTSRCPFVRAVQADDLTTARALSLADGEPCEQAVFDMLVQWAADPDALAIAFHRRS